MYDGKRVSVVLPALNEAEGIGAAVRGFREVREVDEVVVVDNGSTDGTGRIAREAGARVVVEPQRGYGFACRRGLRDASGELVCLTEPDGTFVPADLDRLLPLTREFDAVFGTRTRKAWIEDGARMDVWLRWGNWATAKYLQLLHQGPRLTDVGCTFKVFSRKAVDGVADTLRVGGSHFSPELMLAVIRRGFRCVEIPVRYRRRVGTSKITGNRWRAVRVALRMLWLITLTRFR